MSYLGIERRRFERVAPQFGAILEGTNDVLDALVKDISLKGLYVRQYYSKSRCLRKERLTVHLYAYSVDYCLLVSLRARVVRTDEKGMGLQFGPMTLSNHTKLKAILEHMPASDGDAAVA